MILDEMERNLHKQVPRPYRRPSLREIALISLISFLASPFICATFMMVPLIGQGLVFFLTALVIIFLYVRRSGFIALAIIVSQLAFVIPAVAILPSLKQRMDLAYFLLLATGIPVTILLCLLVAARIWMEIERREAPHVNV